MTCAVRCIGSHGEGVVRIAEFGYLCLDGGSASSVPLWLEMFIVLRTCGWRGAEQCL